MGRMWLLILGLMPVVATAGCGHSEPRDVLGSEISRKLGSVGPTRPNERITASRLTYDDLARIFGEERARAATRPTTGPAARWRWLSADIAFEPGGAAPGRLADDERFTAFGRTFRMASLTDRSTVLTFPNGERLAVDNGVAASLQEMDADALTEAAMIAAAEGPGGAMAAAVGERFGESNSVAHGLARVPQALAAALEERRDAGVDTGPVERAIHELLEAEATGFPAAWRGQSPQRVRLRLNERTRKALADLVRPATAK